MAWKIEFETAAFKELSKISKADAKRIIAFLSERVLGSGDPRSLGQALKGFRLGNLWRYRVSNYRLICDIREKVMVVLVLRMGHKREVYKKP